jgi:hypothetical protein
MATQELKLCKIKSILVMGHIVVTAFKLSGSVLDIRLRCGCDFVSLTCQQSLASLNIPSTPLC